MDQPIAVLDFLGRNRTELRSADHSYHEEIAGDPERAAEMDRVLQQRDLSMVAHWAWFTLNGVSGPYTFPRRLPGPQTAPVVLRPRPTGVRRILEGLRSRLGVSRRS